MTMLTEETRVTTYEGMFLFPHSVTSNLQGAVDHIHHLLERAEAEILSLQKWDERRLAYDIKGNRRGVYFLVYFKAPNHKMRQLERDCNISEQLLRYLFLSAENVPSEQIEAADKRDKLSDEIKMRSESGDSGSASGSSDSVVERGSSESTRTPAAESEWVDPEAAELSDAEDLE